MCFSFDLLFIFNEKLKVGLQLTTGQIRTLMELSQLETNTNNPKEVIRGYGNPVGANHLIRPSLGGEQLISQATGSQMLQQMTRF